MTNASHYDPAILTANEGCAHWRTCKRSWSRIRLIAGERITDGEGSYDLDGHERYIEVKTTRPGAETPFYITSAELDFARRHADRYAVYRVYNVLGEPRFFALEGDINIVLELTAMTYSTRIGAATPASITLSDAAAKPVDVHAPVRADK